MKIFFSLPLKFLKIFCNLVGKEKFGADYFLDKRYEK